MKNSTTAIHIIFLCCFILLILPKNLTAQVSGIKSIPGDYNSITDALQQIHNQGGLSGPTVLELQAGYNSTAEIFPIKIREIDGITQVNNLTISPAAGVTGVSITSSNSWAVFELIGAYYVTIDGRPGRTGSARELTIKNNSATGNALSFFDGATGNTVKHCILDGTDYASNTPQPELLTFGRSADPIPVGVLLSNSSNTVSNCLLKGYTNRSIIASGDQSVQNFGNNITDNEITNFINSGIAVVESSSNWIVTGNSIYGGSFTDEISETGIILQGPIGGNSIVSGNFIGGQATQTGGAAWHNSHHHASAKTTGIFLYDAGSVIVENNTIKNISVTGFMFQDADFIGIISQHTAAQITGNLIGSLPGGDGISLISDGLQVDFKGILNNSCLPVTISNNRISNITMIGDGTSTMVNFAGIEYSGGGNTTISGNQIDQLSANSSGAIHFTAISLSGSITCPVFPDLPVIDYNLVNNITLSSDDGDVILTGIGITARIAANTGNIIGSATVANSITAIGKNVSLTGVLISGSPENVSVSDDIIANLTAIGSLSASVKGIYFNAAGVATISGNDVHHLTAPVSKGVLIQPGNGSSTLILDSNKLTGNNSGTGIETLAAGTATLNLTAGNNTVSNWQTGIQSTRGSDAILQQSFQNNAIILNQTGFINQGGSSVNATCNWWGHASGPSGSGSGTGNPVGPGVNFTPWATISAYVAINAGTDKTIYLGYGPSSKTITPTVTVCGTAQFLWSTGATTASITVSPTVSTVYTVTLTDQYGHSAHDAITVFVQDIRCGNNKVLLCHKESTNKKKTLCISANAVAAHLCHGDILGACATGSRSSEPQGADISYQDIVAQELIVETYNNPTSDKFGIQIRGNLLGLPVTFQVFDMTGKMVETMNNINSGRIIQLGQAYRPGAYYLRVQQGKEHKEIKLIKISQ